MTDDEIRSTRTGKQLKSEIAVGREALERLGSGKVDVNPVPGNLAVKAMFARSDPDRHLVRVRCEGCGEDVGSIVRVDTDLVAYRPAVILDTDPQTTAVHSWMCIRCRAECREPVRNLVNRARKALDERKLLPIRVRPVSSW